MTDELIMTHTQRTLIKKLHDNIHEYGVNDELTKFVLRKTEESTKQSTEQREIFTTYCKIKR